MKNADEEERIKQLDKKLGMNNVKIIETADQNSKIPKAEQTSLSKSISLP
jgi:hypothetical protein